MPWSRRCARRAGSRAPSRYVHNVPFSHRSGERIEPLISLQWFMRMDELAARALEPVRDGRLQIKPEGQRRRYVEWLENIRPWCVSRQLWWGHQIPVYYRGEETYAGLEPPEGEGWERDPDVLDTWFSSQLWPFATLGWPDDTPQLRAFYPTDVLSTARDILFLWVARMVMMGLEFTGEIPFSRVNVHTVIQAPDGRRMSKSLGTGIDPMQLIEGGPRPPVFTEGGDFPAYGADAVRWGLLAISSSQDVRFNEERVAQGRQLANKLYNASRLVLLRLPEDARLPAAAPAPATIEDALDPLAPAGRRARRGAQAIDDFDFHVAALRVYDFVYGELCDWYLELLKPRLYEEDNARPRRVRAARARRDAGARAPADPVRDRGDLEPRPGADDGLLMAPATRWPTTRWSNPEAEAQLGRAIEAVQALRAWRDSVGAKPGRPIPARLEGGGYEATAEHVARLARLEWTSEAGEPVATVAVPGATVAVFASDAVDLEAEQRRSAARRKQLEAEIARSEGKLSNERFVAKAPEAVVQARARQARAGCRRSSRSFDLDRAARRGAPALARAVRHALRPGAHAAAADGARQPAGALRGDPRRRHQRQELDGAHDRRAARGRTACARAPTSRRTWSASPSASGSATRTSPARPSAPRSSAPPRPPPRSTARSRAASA